MPAYASTTFIKRRLEIVKPDPALADYPLPDPPDH